MWLAVAKCVQCSAVWCGVVHSIFHLNYHYHAHSHIPPQLPLSCPLTYSTSTTTIMPTHIFHPTYHCHPHSHIPPHLHKYTIPLPPPLTYHCHPHSPTTIMPTHIFHPTSTITVTPHSHIPTPPTPPGPAGGFLFVRAPPRQRRFYCGAAAGD